MILKSILDTIGNTPLVVLNRISAGLDGTILAKVETFNPGLSKKDRAALEIISAAESTGALRPGQTVVELTSGNMGTGLAIVCAVKGYPFVAVMSKGNSEERARMMRALGAEVVLVNQAPGGQPGAVTGNDLKRVEEATHDIVKERGAFRADQFAHYGNALAHYKHTGPEIWAQSDGMVTAFCDFVGSGGTFSGVSRYLKEKNSSIQCFIVEPEGAAVLSGDANVDAQHPIQGGGYAVAELQQLGNVQADGYITVSGDEARAMANRLAKEEGVFGGYSAGANIAAAIKLLAGPCKGGVVAALVCDSGLKYLSTDLWR